MLWAVVVVHPYFECADQQRHLPARQLGLCVRAVAWSVCLAVAPVLVAACSVFAGETQEGGQPPYATPWLVNDVGAELPIPAEQSDSARSAGPLALVPARPHNEGPIPIVAQAFGGGEIRIGEKCVVVELEQGVATLLWFANEVEFDDTRRSITFSDPTGSVTEVSGAETVEVAGLVATDWNSFVVAPHVECPLSRILVVSLRLRR